MLFPINLGPDVEHKIMKMKYELEHIERFEKTLHYITHCIFDNIINGRYNNKIIYRPGFGHKSIQYELDGQQLKIRYFKR